MGYKQKIKKVLKYFGDKRIKYFKSYNDALIYCENKNKGSYESKLLSKYRFEKSNNFLKNEIDFNVFPWINTFMTSLALYMNKNEGKFPSIIDFGGGCGESFYLVKNIFGEKNLSNSWIIESNANVEESLNWPLTSLLKYSSNLEEVIESNKINFFFSSGTIQYLEDPLIPLKIVAKSRIPLVSLTRNNFSLKKSICAQVSLLSCNGLGTHLKKYGDPKIYYPNSSVKKENLINIFINAGYKLVLDHKSKSGVYGAYNYGGDLIFYYDN